MVAARTLRRIGRVALVAGSLPVAAGVSCAAAPGSDSLRAERFALVRAIEAQGVRDSATLAAMRAVPRHEFVPASERRFAYLDRPLPIGHDQTISQPFIVAFMTESLRPRPGLRTLEIGTGSGYQAAVLAQTGCRVWTIEIVRALADDARARLARLGYRNVQVRHGDGYLGWPEAAPFDAIMLTAAPDSVPAALIAQLAPGGRLVAPVGGEGQVQELIVIDKDARGNLTRRPLLPVRFVPMRRDVR